jgi:acetyl esterase/lipase
MKKILQTITACAAILISADSYAQRYVSEVFSSVDSTQNIVYGSNYTFLSGTPALQPLVFDLYKPSGDVATNRPLVIMIHTGSFLPAIVNRTPTGSMRDSATSEMCRRFARRGYVVASMDYRTGWNPAAFGAAGQDIRTGTLLQAVGRAIQDARACVRYFKKDYATNGNSYGIDTSKIILGGQGSGGYVAFASTTIHDTLEVWKPKFFAATDDTTYGFAAGASYWLSFLWGDFDGNGGNPLFNNPGNSTGYTGDVAMMFNLGGAMGDSSWIGAGDVPMLAFHVVGDPFAPYGEGTVIVPTTGDPVVDVSGSHTAIRKATELGNNASFNSFNYGDAFTARADLINDGYDGLFPFYMSISQAQAGPWEWFDSTTTVNLAVAYGLGSATGTQIYTDALMTNPDMSKAKGMAYIDTIMGYACPRISKALSLGVGVNDMDAKQHVLSVYPNPASASVSLKLENGSKETALVISVTDISGRIVEKAAWNASQSNILTINLRDYAKGVYVIHADGKSFSSKQKLVIQ